MQKLFQVYMMMKICDKNCKKIKCNIKKIKPFEKDEKGKSKEKPLSGEELDDKNLNKLYGAYSKLNPNEDKDKRTIEICDKRESIMGIILTMWTRNSRRRRAKFIKGGKLIGKFIKICYDRNGIEGYDKNGIKLDGTYKIEETGVEPFFAYNENWKKKDWIFVESKDELDFPAFNKKGNKLNRNAKRLLIVLLWLMPMIKIELN